MGTRVCPYCEQPLYTEQTAMFGHSPWAPGPSHPDCYRQGRAREHRERQATSKAQGRIARDMRKQGASYARIGKALGLPAGRIEPMLDTGWGLTLPTKPSKQWERQVVGVDGVVRCPTPKVVSEQPLTW